MKVSELIEKLNEFDPDLEVIKSKDEEGNDFYDLWAIQKEYWVPDWGVIAPEDVKEYTEEHPSPVKEKVVIW